MAKVNPFPLKRGHSPAVIAANIAEGIRAGRDPSQAAAIAYDAARKCAEKAGKFPAHLYRTNPTDYVLMVFQPHTGATGYWNGANWDTDPQTALRAHRADVLEPLLKDRAKTLPPGWRVGIQAAPDMPMLEGGRKKNPIPKKQDWEMTLKEYENVYGKPRRSATSSVGNTQHRNVVGTALNRGLPVPPDVLAEYPDLKPPRKTVSRKKNPVPASQYAKMKEAVERYREFTGMEPDVYDRWTVEYPEVGFCIGTLDAVLYTTVRDGQLEHYKHEFNEKSRPLLCSTHDGQQLVIVGGQYQFTERGIVDG